MGFNSQYIKPGAVQIWGIYLNVCGEQIPRLSVFTERSSGRQRYVSRGVGPDRGHAGKQNYSLVSSSLSLSCLVGAQHLFFLYRQTLY